jgi:hypothetical protein
MTQSMRARAHLAVVGVLGLVSGFVLMLLGLAALTEHYRMAEPRLPEVVPADYAIPLLVASFVVMIMGAAFIIPSLRVPPKPPKNDSSPLLSFQPF